MKRAYLKTGGMYLAGIGMGGIVVFGCYPLGIAYFAAVTLQTGGWYLAFPAVMFGMALTASVLNLVKYGISMILFVVLSGIIEEQRGLCSKNMMAVLGGACLLAMNVTGWLMSVSDVSSFYMGAAEAVLAGSLTVVFYQILQKLLCGKEKRKEPRREESPETQRLRESAAVLEKLSACFDSMPDKKEPFGRQDMEDMFYELSGHFCKVCERCNDCWQKNYMSTYKQTYELFREIEEYGDVVTGERQFLIARNCIHAKKLIHEVKNIFERTKTNLLWYNRVLENRTAMAVQLSEVAKMMVSTADDFLKDSLVPADEKAAIVRKLQNHHVTVNKIRTLSKAGRIQLYLTIKSDRRRLVPVREVSNILSEVYQKRITADQNSRLLLGREENTVLFTEDTSFRVLHGVSRVPKKGEQISGDNFSLYFGSDGKMTACLSDGMGSGVFACRESELLIELLERFLEAGFCKETALRMINSTMVTNSRNSSYSTFDLVEVDLYTGLCDFVKLGASYTFIRRENIVETIQPDSLPLGMFHQEEFSHVTKKLYDGDYVIMISDGMVSSLPVQLQTSFMEEIIMNLTCVNPREMANYIMEKMLAEYSFEPEDDMTVLVFGVWQK